MSISRSSLRLVCFVVLLVAPNAARAQLNVGNQWPTPRLTSVFPPGAKVGSDVTVNVTGIDLDRPESLWFSHPGLKGVIVPDDEPDPKTDPKADPKKEPKKEMTKKKEGPISVVKMKVTVGKDVPLGQYDVRIVTARGISNPRVFVVGDLEEVREKEPNNDVDLAQQIGIGVTVNGAIQLPTDVDYYKFPGKKGQRVLLNVAGASIDSRINPEITVFDTQNRRLAYGRALPNDDLLVDFTPPADGDYFIRLNQFTYTAGTADYFYRLKVWPGPWIDAVFPPVVEAGKPATLTVYGRGLPGGTLDPNAQHLGKPLEKLTVKITAPSDEHKLDVLGVIPPHQGLLNGFEYRLGNSNSKFLAFAQAPVVVENDDNDGSEKAQDVTTPCEIVGRVDKKRDRDWFAFEAKKGKPLFIDAISHRLGAPTDLYFKIVDAKKKDIVTQDDQIEFLNPRGYFNVSRDPAQYRFVPPEDGKYHLLVASHNADIVAGPAYVYRVRIAPERPDFQLAVIPAEDYRAEGFTIGRGGVNFFNVFVERLDGFKGEVALTVEGLPKGVTCPRQTLSSKSAKLAIVAAADAPEKFEGVIKVIGTATIGGKKVVREARPASVTWGFTTPQNTAPTITRHDRALLLAIRDKAPLSVTPKKEKAVVIAGEKVDIPYKLNRLDSEFTASFQIKNEAGELPPGITVGGMTFAPGKDEQTLTLSTTPQTVPGIYNLVLRGYAPLPKIKNVIMPTAPVTLVVLPKQVVAMTTDNPAVTLNVGGETKVSVKVARTFDYSSNLIVKLLPEGANGVTVEDATIAPGDTLVKVTFKAAEDASPGARQNLILRAVAVVDGVDINNDLKLSVVVNKVKK